MALSHGHLFSAVSMALASAVLFGATPAFAKLLLESVQPIMLAGLLYLGAGAGRGVYAVIRRANMARLL